MNRLLVRRWILGGVMVATAAGSTTASLLQAPWYVPLPLTLAGVAACIAMLWSFKR